MGLLPPLISTRANWQSTVRLVFQTVTQSRGRAATQTNSDHKLKRECPITSQLYLPPFDAAESAFAEYLATLSDYRKNTYAEIDPEVKSLLVREWSRSFEEWGYEA